MYSLKSVALSLTTSATESYDHQFLVLRFVIYGTISLPLCLHSPTFSLSLLFYNTFMC
jgi:hypothetical protein